MKKVFFTLACLFFCVGSAFAATEQYDTHLYFFDAKTLGAVTPTTTLINVWVGIKGTGNVGTGNNAGIVTVGNCELYDLGGYLLPFQVVTTWVTDTISTDSDGEKIIPLTQIKLLDKSEGLPYHLPQGGIIINANFTLGTGDNALNLRASKLEAFDHNS